MVFCFVALAVFGVLGIFSASHRKLFFEALNCVTRTVTLRPCETNFDAKMRAKIASGLLKFSPALSRFVFQHFQALSLAFVVLMIGSFALFGVGVYNWYVFGNCNGPDSNAFCVLNEVWGVDCKSKTGYGTPSFVNVHVEGDVNAPLSVLEFGCYSCPFTAAAENDVHRLLSEFEGRVNFAFKGFPLPNHEQSREMALAAECASAQGKFQPMKDLLFENQAVCGQVGRAAIDSLAQQAGLDMVSYHACMATQQFAFVVNANEAEGNAVGICGTPTFFVGSKALVAPSLDELRQAIVAELAIRRA